MEPHSSTMDTDISSKVEELGEDMNQLVLDNPSDAHNESIETIDYSSIECRTDDESSYDESSDEEDKENNDDAMCLQSDASSEDWDSDSYWQPPYHIRPPSPNPALWVYFIKKKMEEGNFCPMDMHAQPVMEKISYDRIHNPRVTQIVDGQFDDLSEDES